MTLVKKPIMKSNNGCLVSGFKLTAILIIIISICLVLFSCGDKEGCGDYSKWESKTSFRSK